jgi:hypothetical protein
MELQDFFKSLGDYGCFAIDYAVASLDGNLDWREITNKIFEAKDNGAFDDEIFVYNPLAFGLKDVKKVSSLEKCKGEWALANYVYGKKNHVALYKKVSDGYYEPYYNSLENSQCVKYGRIQDVRDVYIYR